MITPNSYLNHYCLWEHHFLFTPTLSGKQKGRKTKVTCNRNILSEEKIKIGNDKNKVLKSQVYSRTVADGWFKWRAANTS